MNRIDLKSGMINGWYICVCEQIPLNCVDSLERKMCQPVASLDGAVLSCFTVLIQPSRRLLVKCQNLGQVTALTSVVLPNLVWWRM